MARAHVGFNQGSFPLQEATTRYDQAIKGEGKPSWFFSTSSVLYFFFFNAIFSVSVGYLMLPSAPRWTADINCFRLISKPVPRHGESRDKPVLTQLSAVVLVCEDYGEKFFLFPPQLLVLKLFTETKQGYQNTDSISSCCSLPVRFQSSYSFSFLHLMGEHVREKMHTIFLGGKCVLFSALRNQKLRGGLYSSFQIHLF